MRYVAAPEIAAAIHAHRDWIAGETLATSLEAATGITDPTVAPVDDLEFAFILKKT